MSNWLCYLSGQSVDMLYNILYFGVNKFYQLNLFYILGDSLGKDANRHFLLISLSRMSRTSGKLLEFWFGFCCADFDGCPWFGSQFLIAVYFGCWCIIYILNEIQVLCGFTTIQKFRCWSEGLDESVRRVSNGKQNGGVGVEGFGKTQLK